MDRKIISLSWIESKWQSLFICIESFCFHQFWNSIIQKHFFLKLEYSWTWLSIVDHHTLKVQISIFLTVIEAYHNRKQFITEMKVNWYSFCIIYFIFCIPIIHHSNQLFFAQIFRMFLLSSTKLSIITFLFPFVEFLSSKSEFSNRKKIQCSRLNLNDENNSNKLCAFQMI